MHSNAPVRALEAKGNPCRQPLTPPNPATLADLALIMHLRAEKTEHFTTPGLYSWPIHTYTYERMLCRMKKTDKDISDVDTLNGFRALNVLELYRGNFTLQRKNVLPSYW